MIIFLPFVLSLDSFFASFALSAFRTERSRRIKLAVTFGICDGVASLVRGAFVFPTRNMSWLTSHQFHVTIGAYLIALFLVCLFEAVKPLGTTLLWTVPVILSVDNLVGPSAVPTSLGFVALAALVSASMSLTGLSLGTFFAGIAYNLASQRSFLRKVTP